MRSGINGEDDVSLPYLPIGAGRRLLPRSASPDLNLHHILSVLDERFSHFEKRWITMGSTEKGEVVVGAHLYFVEEPEERIRIISARRAAPRERRQYEKIKSNDNNAY